jgi:uncharacterized protein (DUF1697 family)
VAEQRYVALIRGINVGGRNLIKMTDLKQAFEQAGFESVRTHIQSGNVIFESGSSRTTLEQRLEGMLEQRFGVPLVVVVRSKQQLRTVVYKAPKGFGKHPDTFHSDVIFLRAPLTGKQAMGVVKLRDGVDQAWPANGVVYFARLSAERTKSRLSSIVGTAEYKQMTIRNWSTTTKLLAMLDE